MTASVKVLLLVVAMLAWCSEGSIRSAGSSSLDRSLFYEQYYKDLSLSFSMTYPPSPAPTKNPPPIGGMSKKGKVPKCKPGKKDKKNKKGKNGKSKGKGPLLPPGKGPLVPPPLVPPGKGKGKGSQTESPGKGEGKGKGSQTESPGKGKGKGKGSQTESPGKGKGKGKGSQTKSPGKGKGSLTVPPGMGEAEGMGKGKRILPEKLPPKDKKAIPPPPSGKGKGKGKVKGMGKGKGGPIPITDDDNFCTEFPSEEPATVHPGTEEPQVGPTPSPKLETTEPTALMPPESEVPGATTAPTPLPGPGEDQYVVLSPFSVLYTIEQIRIPSTSDYIGLTDLTATYLDQFFSSTFASVKEVVYLNSTTENTASDFRLGEPVSVSYNVTILFSSTSTLIPQVSELDSVVQMAFTGQQGTMYLGQLMALPATNIFQTTSVVSFSATATLASHGGKGRFGVKSTTLSSNAGIAAVAGAGALVLAAAAFFFSHRRRGDARDQILEKPFDHDGHITVAGDTYAETFGGDSQSGVLSSRTGMESHWSNYNEAVNLMKRPPSPESSPVSLDLARQRGDETGSESDADSVRAQAHHHRFEDVAL